MRLDGKVAVVTGGGFGFGEGIARRFATEGARVVVGDLRSAEAARVASAIEEAGGTACAVEADVATRSGNAAMAEQAMTTFGRLDVVVNNAGISHPNQPLLDVDEATFDRVYAVNVKSLYWSAHVCVPLFRAQGGGGFINIASTAGLRPRPGLTWYNGSKGAAIMISKSMAVELAPDRIRVNAICPVIGETGLTSTFMGGDSPELRAKFIGTIPLGRMSRPADIAAAALYLASDEAEFVTGVALEVDGGRCV